MISSLNGHFPLSRKDSCTGRNMVRQGQDWVVNGSSDDEVLGVRVEWSFANVPRTDF